MKDIASAIAVTIMKRRLGEGGQIRVPSLGITLSWRPDGWPLCPHCGEDELYSLLRWNGEGDKPPLEEWITLLPLSLEYGTEVKRQKAKGKKELSDATYVDDPDPAVAE